MLLSGAVGRALGSGADVPHGGIACPRAGFAFQSPRSSISSSVRCSIPTKLFFTSPVRYSDVVELDLDGRIVSVLGILDQEHHQKRNDGRPCVDDQLPGVGIAKTGPLAPQMTMMSDASTKADGLPAARAIALAKSPKSQRNGGTLIGHEALREPPAVTPAGGKLALGGLGFLIDGDLGQSVSASSVFFSSVSVCVEQLRCFW